MRQAVFVPTVREYGNVYASIQKPADLRNNEGFGQARKIADEHGDTWSYLQYRLSHLEFTAQAFTSTLSVFFPYSIQLCGSLSI
jgi:hypothetical protein